MNIEEILKGPQRRVKTVSIDGLPDLVLTEPMAAERFVISENMPSGNENNIQNKFIASELLKSLLGYKRSPSDEESQKFLEQYGMEVLDSLWLSLMNFAAIDKNAVDDAKKP